MSKLSKMRKNASTDMQNCCLLLHLQVSFNKGQYDEIFKELPNIFCIADDRIIVGYDKDGADHDDMLRKVLKLCRQENLKLNINKCN